MRFSRVKCCSERCEGVGDDKSCENRATQMMGKFRSVGQTNALSVLSDHALNERNWMFPLLTAWLIPQLSHCGSDVEHLSWDVEQARGWRSCMRCPNRCARPVLENFISSASKNPILSGPCRRHSPCFRGSGFASHRISPSCDRPLRSSTHGRHNGGIITAVFEVKKEIPDKRHDPQTALSDETSARPRRARR